MVTLATTATSTAGSTATIENRLTIWTWRRAAALPLFSSQDQLPHFSDDDPDQEQDRRGVDQVERADDLGRRIDPGKAGQDQEGQEGRQQRQRDGKGCQPASHRPTPGLFRWGRVKVCGRGICAGHSGNGGDENGSATGGY
jgi:hypothetical protein